MVTNIKKVRGKLSMVKLIFTSTIFYNFHRFELSMKFDIQNWVIFGQRVT